MKNVMEPKNETKKNEVKDQPTQEIIQEQSNQEEIQEELTRELIIEEFTIDEMQGDSICDVSQDKQANDELQEELNITEIKDEPQQELTADETLEEAQKRVKNTEQNTEPKKMNIINIIGIVMCVVLLPLFIINGILYIKTLIKPDAIPSIFGYSPLVMGVDDMSPALSKGDLIIFKNVGEKSEPYEKGTIIIYTFKSTYVTQMITGSQTTEDGKTNYIVQNTESDVSSRNTIPSLDIVGVYSTHISQFGKVVVFSQTPVGMLCFLFLPLLAMFAASYYFLYYRNKKAIK